VEPGLLLRAGSTGDLDRIVAIQEAASLRALAHIFPPDRYPFPREAIRVQWEAWLADDGANVIVAEADGEPAGVVVVEPGWLAGLYALPERWGGGVGPRLHDEAVDRLRRLDNGCARLWVLKENGRARRFYERRGWLEDGRTRVVPFPPNPLDVGYSLDLG